MTEDELVKSWLRLCRDPRSAPEQLEKACYWESIARPSLLEIRLAAAHHRAASGDLLANLSTINNLRIQIAVAAHPNLSEATANLLARSQLRELRRTLAANPRIPLYVMKRLSRDFEDVRLRLARNTSIPEAIMVELLRQKSSAVRRGLASNPCLTLRLMEYLAKDPDLEVRRMIASHPSLPLEGLLTLAADPAVQVRQVVWERAVAEYARELRVFSQLAQFQDGEVADRARAQIELIQSGQEGMTAEPAQENT
jgi:hypothetical protein